MLTTRTTLFAALSMAAALTLTSCAGGSPAATPSAASETSTFNTADVIFAQMMIPHHEQAVEMSDDLLAKDGIDQDVVDLAADIKTAQQPEIDRMQGWLTEWDAEEDSMAGMDHGSDGMMSAEDMTMLQDASGTDASRLFLQQMTLHHEGAVAMAQLEIDDGENADAVKMATGIVTTQTAEIAVMADLLETL
ncbi:DUF305 domain-containing protein [Cryobacterium melibiosiphilum]|uniref:DUF305 domain-containing protein n=1 Tax=Cryobacterium melibiosiphilum TaxID=995039 RepID=A0A3A5MAL7_9MICO|nr:DUF305 domain-containing protein [Cryobacterium melibiosiphilum]RJT85118.1 DUF305 domain-containing protein [Cryobacterium melibiosiphilum]